MKPRRSLLGTLAALLGGQAPAGTDRGETLPGARRWLLANYHHYRRLPASQREAFDHDVGLFLVQKRITGVSFDVTDEARLQVAASAVTLSLAWKEYNWDQLTEVLLYPDDFDRDFRFDDPEFAGQAHPWGTVLLSAPSLEDSFADPQDGFHVGLHEFTHLLNLGGDGIGGVPAGVGGERARIWLRLVEAEMERLRNGDSVLDPYADSDPVEFFPVTVEAFFERPAALRRSNAELYAFLAEYFVQDPASWDDALGLGVEVRGPRARAARPARR